MPVEKEILHIWESGDAKRPTDALITLTLTPSLLLLLREDTILIISSGVGGEAKKLSPKEQLKTCGQQWSGEFYYQEKDQC